MELFVFLVCVTGFVLTVRHLIYWTKVSNESSYWMEQRIGPVVLGRNGYRQMHLDLLERLRRTSEGRRRIKNHDLGDLAFRLDPYDPSTRYPSDYSKILLYSTLFPLYWLFVFLNSAAKSFTDSGRKTPGQLREEQQYQEWERQYQGMKTRYLYEETERLRREQDGT